MSTRIRSTNLKVRLILGVIYLGILAAALLAVDVMLSTNQQNPDDLSRVLTFLFAVPTFLTELISYGYAARLSDVWIAVFLCVVAAEWWPLPVLIVRPDLWRRRIARYIIAGYLIVVTTINALTILGLLFMWLHLSNPR